MMQQTDLRWFTTDSPILTGSGRSSSPSHVSQSEPTLTHATDTLPDGHICGWESAWIDLGGEG
jgi:hypothetical protein